MKVENNGLIFDKSVSELFCRISSYGGMIELSGENNILKITFENLDELRRTKDFFVKLYDLLRDIE